ncbi:MAG: hypothetical protein ABSH38_00910 [Verrucomicrobiota bacterium]|jgi:hypothetical protein
MNHVHDEAIRTAIAAVTTKLAPVGNSGWQFTLLNGAPHVVTAKTDGDWVLFETDCTGAAQCADSFWEALVRNASFDGLAKIVLTYDGSPRLRAEIPVTEDVVLTTRVREVCRGFEAEWTHKDEHSLAEASPEGAEPMDLKSLCSEAGWPFVERGDRKLAVELEVPGGFSQALLIPTEHGVRITCEVATLDAIAEECRQAVSGFLLAASGLVRMGRASVNAIGTSPAAQFEVVFGTAPSPPEISSALECLSIACSLCGEEIKTLQVPAIAERYLALRGWDAAPAARRNERTVTP